ncbi:hypothetical protein BDV33DRAFT_210301 [Aspergillus novoparasiticus]|uniref:VWFA domain-containing protein n=1 Tax=Aspergillus novoparasiticus TaxID=986946 RepID=A0A5N6E8D1_9EURO|nr:hypothetical protein BDV33DRAFT_210301 [Aspergillus novoparasiticus]
MTRLTSKTWSGWERVLKLNSAQSNYAAPSLFEGIQAAIRCLVAEQSAQRASKLLLVSDIVDHVYLSQSNADNITASAIANGVSIYSLGVGLHHNADLLSSLSRRTWSFTASQSEVAFAFPSFIIPDYILVNIEILPSSKASAVSKRYKAQQIDIYQFPLLQFWLSSQRVSEEQHHKCSLQLFQRSSGEHIINYPAASYSTPSRASNIPSA